MHISSNLKEEKLV